MSAQVGISTNTIGRFLNGESWPRLPQLAAIERAIAWPANSIVAVANGEPIPVIPEALPDSSERAVTAPTEPSSVSSSDTITVSLAPGALDGLDPLAIAQVEAEARVAALRFLRELQASRSRREEETTP